jgi:hypothetical protein
MACAGCRTLPALSEAEWAVFRARVSSTFFSGAASLRYLFLPRVPHTPVLRVGLAFLFASCYLLAAICYPLPNFKLKTVNY